MNKIALGNWACMTWNAQGQGVEGKFQHDNISVEVYKDWLILGDDEEWTNRAARLGEEKMRFTRPYVMEIKNTKGDVVTYQDRIKIFAIRSEQVYQHAIFFIIQAPSTDNLLIGIACYGYHGDLWVGVKQQTEELFRAWYGFMQIKLAGEFNNLPVRLEENEGYNQGEWFVLKEVVKIKVKQRAEKIIEEELAKGNTPVLCRLCDELISQKELEEHQYLHIVITPPYVTKPSASGHVHMDCGLERFQELKKELNPKNDNNHPSTTEDRAFAEQ